MGVITIKADPVMVRQNRQVFAEAIRIPLRSVNAENRVSVRLDREVVGNGLVETDIHWNYTLNSLFSNLHE